MKFFIVCLIFIFSTGISSASDITSSLLEESDFHALSLKMKEKSLGLVLMLHAEDCPYCALMEKEILSPMIKSGDYDDRVFIRKLQIDDARDVKDFDGKVVEPSDISKRYEATLTPTLIFLDYQGNLKAETMVGIGVIDYVGVYIDAEIDKLMANIKLDSSPKTATANSKAASSN